MKIQEISAVTNNVPCPQVEGCYMRNLTFRQLEELQNLAKEEKSAKDAEEHHLKILVWLFQHALVDVNDEPFTDTQTPENIRDNLPSNIARFLVEDAIAHFAGDKEGNSQNGQG